MPREKGPRACACMTGRGSRCPGRVRAGSSASFVRRNRRDPERRAYYLVFCPAGTTLAELAGVAGLRWTIEECFQWAKDDLGLDHCEARSWHGWHRHMSLVMAAAAFLARLAADLRRTTWDVADQPATVTDKANERSPTAEAA